MKGIVGVSNKKAILLSVSLCCLLLALHQTAAQQGGGAVGRGGHRRKRRVNQFFPGCLNLLWTRGGDNNNSSSSSSRSSGGGEGQTNHNFIECVQERGDERCLSNDPMMAKEIGTCVENGLVVLREEEEEGMMMTMMPKGMGNGNGSQGGIGNGNGGGNNKGNPQNNGGGRGYGNNGNGNRNRHRRQVMIASLVRNCTTDYRDCASEKLEEDIETLPTCVPQSMRNLTTCIRENRQTCRRSCRRQDNTTTTNNNNTLDDDDDEQQQWQGGWPEALPVQSLQNCNGVRNRIFRRVCRRGGNCCPDCLQQLETVGDCFLNTVMQHLPETCTIDCREIGFDTEEEEENSTTSDGYSNNSRRRWMQQQQQQGGGGGGGDGEEKAAAEQEASMFVGFHTLRRALVAGTVEGGEEIYNACIEMAPGLNENNRNDAEELALRWDFFDCVVDEMLVLIEEEEEEEEDGEPSSSSSGDEMSVLIDDEEEDSEDEEDGEPNYGSSSGCPKKWNHHHSWIGVTIVSGVVGALLLSNYLFA